MHRWADAERWRALFETAGDAIVVCDLETAEMVEANSATCAMLGYTREELGNMTGRMLSPASEDEKVALISKGLNEKGYGSCDQMKMIRKDGSTFWCDTRCWVYDVDGRKFYLAIIRDVTERVESSRALAEAQAMLLHSSKLASIGQLAAGVAHEINNPAAFVLANVHVMSDLVERCRDAMRAMRGQGDVGVDRVLDQYGVDHSLTQCAEMLADNREGVRRICKIVADLRVFSQEDPTNLIAVDLHDIVDAACTLVGNEIRHRAHLVKAISKVPRVTADRGQLIQVVTNLLMNAAQAIEPGSADDNTIELTTDVEGDEVSLTIADTGCGVPNQDHERVFEPFFTTKSKSEGVGLGLALSLQIVRQFGGGIELRDRQEGGTKVTVKLKRAETPKRTSPAPPQTPHRGRVLILDDEEALLRAYQRMLPGYEVVTASDGGVGLEILSRDRDFDVIFCDLMMPDVGGIQVYEHLRANDPDLRDRLVFATGGAFTQKARDFVAKLDVPVLRKPIDMYQLTALIDKMADH